MVAKELNICNECGSDDIQLTTNHFTEGQTEFVVFCNECDNRENSYESFDEAKYNWNENNSASFI